MNPHDLSIIAKHKSKYAIPFTEETRDEFLGGVGRIFEEGADIEKYSLGEGEKEFSLEKRLVSDGMNTKKTPMGCSAVYLFFDENDEDITLIIPSVKKLRIPFFHGPTDAKYALVPNGTLYLLDEEIFYMRVSR